MDTTLLAILSGPILLLVREGIAWYVARRKADMEADEHDDAHSLAANEQALKIYKDIIQGLKDDMGKLMKSMHEQDSVYLKTMEENLSLRLEVQSLKERVRYLEEKLKGQGQT